MKLSYLESKIFGKVCYGFRPYCDGIIEIVPDKANVVKTIFFLYLKGNSLEYIQKHLHKYDICSPSGKDIWTRDVLNKLLDNQKYTFGIIDIHIFFEVKDMKSGNCRNPNRNIEEQEEWQEQQKQSYFGPTQ